MLYLSSHDSVNARRYSPRTYDPNVLYVEQQSQPQPLIEHSAMTLKTLQSWYLDSCQPAQPKKLLVPAFVTVDQGVCVLGH